MKTAAEEIGSGAWVELRGLPNLHLPWPVASHFEPIPSV
jgi:hypothetical protein